MGHFAVIAPPLYSHFHALQALVQTLLARGHRITFIQQANACTLLSDERIHFVAVGERTHPAGSLAACRCFVLFVIWPQPPICCAADITERALCQQQVVLTEAT